MDKFLPPTSLMGNLYVYWHLTLQVVWLFRLLSSYIMTENRRIIFRETFINNCIETHLVIGLYCYYIYSTKLLQGTKNCGIFHSGKYAWLLYEGQYNFWLWWMNKSWCITLHYAQHHVECCIWCIKHSLFWESSWWHTENLPSLSW